uniref:Peptidase S1 domain-containing protein n=1 Tax=Clastoptera arizonana TaxID=38151 RepID=A0A1B6E6T3_9HEMI
MNGKPVIVFFFITSVVIIDRSNSFMCRSDYKIIDNKLLCDGIYHCMDFSDEDQVLCNFLDDPKFKNYFNCRDGTQIPHQLICDGKNDCLGGEDEISQMCIRIEKSCILPKSTLFTKYNISGCTNSKCLTDYNGNTYIPTKSKVTVSCAKGFVADSTNISLCLGSHWVPRLTTCRSLMPTCPPIKITNRMDYLFCQDSSGLETNCQEILFPGTIVYFTCKKFYKPSTELITCLSNGTWSHNVKCIPECGQNKDSVTMIMHGTKAELGEWPWAAGLYHQAYNSSWEFYCGATLISESSLITAAHCVWDNDDPKEFAVSLGTIHRDNITMSDREENIHQFIKIRNIITPEVYQDQEGNYGSDIAILILQRPVSMSAYIRPACLPWLNLSHIYPNPGEIVTVAGWGLNENHKPSNYLNFIKIPVVLPKTCIGTQPSDFRKYITHTTFCAGLLNGTNVCNGDSGSGMMYYNKNKWELVGVVSVSPRQQGTSFCQLRNAYALFTKVVAYIPWLYKNFDIHK